MIDGCIIELLPSVTMAAIKTGVTESHDVLIYGQGLTGLLITRVLYLNGCKNLIVADMFDEKLNISKEFGASKTINTTKEDINEYLCRYFSKGVDVSIIATSNSEDIKKAIEWTRVRGKIVNFGAIGNFENFDYYPMHKKGISLIKERSNISGILEFRKLWRESMELIADGLLSVSRLRTHIFLCLNLKK